MKTKKLLSIILTVTLLAGIAVCNVSAAEAPTVYVTVANGELCLTQKAVTVTDVDGDGSLTLCDALQLAHAASYEGGADGFEVSNGLYGPYITKLWGVANGGSYGIYVNDTAAMTIGDAVKDGDHVYAFVYTDLTAYSDSYCFFDLSREDINTGDALSLTLTALGYNESWELVKRPVANAVLTIDGKDTEFKTDENGKVSVILDDALEAGAHTLSAHISDFVAIPPVCTVYVNSSTEPVPTGDTAGYVIFATVAVAVIGAALLFGYKKCREE